jgi:hypothetical protein
VRLPVGHRLFPARQVFLNLVQGLLTAQQPVLQLRQLLPTFLHLGFSPRSDLVQLILELYPGFPPEGFSLTLRVLQHLASGHLGGGDPRLSQMLAPEETPQRRKDRHDQHYYDPQHCAHWFTTSLSRITAA